VISLAARTEFAVATIVPQEGCAEEEEIAFELPRIASAVLRVRRAQFDESLWRNQAAAIANI
jgi:hypothetical protein